MAAANAHRPPPTSTTAAPSSSPLGYGAAYLSARRATNTGMVRSVRSWYSA